MPVVALIAQDPGTPPTAAGPRAGGNPAAKADPLALIVPAVLLGAVLLAGAAVLYFADQWRKRASRGGSETESLTDFRGMLERGEITEAEYKVLRDRMAAKMKKSLTKPGPTPPAPPPSPTNGGLGEPQGPGNEPS